jgi:hypothetical protein
MGRKASLKTVLPARDRLTSNQGLPAEAARLLGRDRAKGAKALICEIAKPFRAALKRAAIVNSILTMGAQRQDSRVGENVPLARSPAFLIVHPWGDEQCSWGLFGVCVMSGGEFETGLLAIFALIIGSALAVAFHWVPFLSNPPLPSDDELRQALEEFWTLRVAVDAAERATAARSSDSQSAPPAPFSPNGENIRVLYPDGQKTGSRRHVRISRR